jgi:hypothetical protein
VRASSAIALGIWAFGVGSFEAAPNAPLQVAFHHIHVNDRSSEWLIAHYGKLFRASTTKAVDLGGHRGIESAGVFLLITPVKEEPPKSGGPGWHFGWGAVSLEEAYDRHRMKEVDLKLPMESFAKELHLHLESDDPIRAASWYRNRLDAQIMTDARVTKVRPPNPLHRRPGAIVALPGITLAIYQAVTPIAGSRGHRIDHIAFTADLHEARAAGLTVLEHAGRLGPFETMTVEGPDRLAIELVGAPAMSRVDTRIRGTSAQRAGIPAARRAGRSAGYNP